MSRSKGKLHRAEFCPWCGCATLERDDYRNPRNSRVEFVCLTCGAAFRLTESQRRMFANRAFAEERKIRGTPQDAFRQASKAKFKEYQREAIADSKRIVGERIQEWLQGEEATRLREAAREQD